ncbi:MAG: PIN domain-containing protein [bacterium]
MKELLVDTNAWLRYLLQDNDDQSKEMQSLMKRMKAGEVELILTNEVVLEVCYVLKSVYTLEKKKISKGLSDLVLVKGIVANSIWKTVLLLYSQKNLSLIDILMKCLARANGWDFFTFDKKLRKEVLE